MKAYYKEPFDLELGDVGIFEGKRYKLLKTETSLNDNEILTLEPYYDPFIPEISRDTKTLHNVPAYKFAVEKHSLDLDEFVLLYKKAKELRYI